MFEDVNIKLTEGNHYDLIGSNGVGKSIFLKILSYQLEPTNGKVVITPSERLCRKYSYIDFRPNRKIGNKPAKTVLFNILIRETESITALNNRMINFYGEQGRLSVNTNF